ncbi:MAG TPA: DUF4389 domain-containing protein [Acidimicrobiales bacterium]|nr:DUF4389 domain-containing protein [Acidimicrobiales bacterium]
MSNAQPTTADAPQRVELSIDGPVKQSVGSVLLRGLLAIPSMIILMLYQFLMNILVFFGWFTALGKGRMSESTEAQAIKTLTYQARVLAYLYWLTPENPGSPDSQSQTVHVSIQPAASTTGSVFFRNLLAIPGMIVAMVGSIVLLFTMIGMWFKLVFGGGQVTEQQQISATRKVRYFIRLGAFMALLTPLAPSGLSGDPEELGSVPARVAAA